MSRPGDATVALRHSVVVTPLTEMRALRFSGPDARRALERLCAGTIRVRDGQLQHILLLHDDATPFADGFLLCDDDRYELLYEGPDPEAMRAHVADHLPIECKIALEDRSTSHAIIGIDGPFAWELVSRLAGAEAVGLPYLTFFKTDAFCCFRAGRTGEYGYGLIVERDTAAALVQGLHAQGADLDVVPGTRDALELAALENFFFNIHREGQAELTPLELQLQWRVNRAGNGVGVAALNARRAAGIAQRVTTLLATGRMGGGDLVLRASTPIGRVLHASWSPSRREWVALALLDIGFAIPGLTKLRVRAAEGEVQARTVTPPVLNNASLFVSAQMHSYATRGEIERPSLVRP